MKNLLAIDVGNSNIVIGLFEGVRLKWHRRFATAKGISLLKKIWLQHVDGIIVASVVPAINQPLRCLLKKKFGIPPIFVSSKTKLPIKIKTKTPSQVGADRIANAVAVYCRRAIIVVDFGTATTFDVVSETGEYLGGPIAPGIGIANAALHEKTAKLPLVPIKRPKRVIGRETSECIQAGVLFGYAGLVDGLVARIQKEYGQKMRVIATGGLAPLIVPLCRSVKKVEPNLTLQGLRILSLSRSAPPQK